KRPARTLEGRNDRRSGAHFEPDLRPLAETSGLRGCSVEAGRLTLHGFSTHAFDFPTRNTRVENPCHWVGVIPTAIAPHSPAKSTPARQQNPSPYSAPTATARSPSSAASCRPAQPDAISANPCSR